MNAVANQVELNPEPRAIVPVTPMEMLAQALARGADMQQLEKLLELQERWERNEARKGFVAAMAAFKANPPEILKDKHVSYKNKTGGFTEYDHATLGAVCAAIVKALGEHEIAHRWDVAQQDNRIKVTCILTHAQGHSESVSLNSGVDDSGGKNAIQAIGSAVTYLQRYTLLSATGLAAAEMDDDGKSTSTAAPGYFITESQITDLMALAEEVKADRAQFLKYMKVTQLAEIPASQYKVAVAGLESKRKG